MQIFIHTDRNIALTDKQRDEFQLALARATDRFGARVTRIDAHLSDINSTRGGASDKRCVLEARRSGRNPFVVEHQAGTINLAVSGASTKLASALDSAFGRMFRMRSRSIGHARAKEKTPMPGSPDWPPHQQGDRHEAGHDRIGAHGRQHGRAADARGPRAGRF